jgi:hypothetical protein
MIAIYKKIPAKKIRAEAKQAIKGIEDWFKSNPDKNVCIVGCWYGKQVQIRREHIAEDVNAARDAALK